MTARTHLALAGAAAAIALVPAAAPAAICKYTIEVLQPSIPGYDDCWAAALNEVDQVAGTCAQDPGEEKRVFLYRAGVTIDAGVLSGFNQGYGYGLNNHGHVVGFSAISFDPSANDAHLYRGGPLEDVELWATTFSMFDTWANDINDAGEIVGIDDYDHAVYWVEGHEPIYLADYGSKAFAINEAGQIAGSATFGSERHAARWDGPFSIVDLGTLPGGAFSEARDIAENGSIAGVASSPDGLRGFFHDPAAPGLGLQRIGTFGGSSSTATAVSSLGQVVGYANDAQQGSHGFLWRKGLLYDLDQLLHHNPSSDPWHLFTALDINEKGVILASAYTSSTGAYVLLRPQSCSLSSSQACCPF